MGKKSKPPVIPALSINIESKQEKYVAKRLGRAECTDMMR
jgi:hypothetical protein